MAITNGFSTRLDNGFAVGLRRYANTDGNALWMLEISEHPTLGSCSSALRMIASDRCLADLLHFANQAQAALYTDGGRAEVEALAPEGSR